MESDKNKNKILNIALYLIVKKYNLNVKLSFKRKFTLISFDHVCTFIVIIIIMQH